MDLVPFALAFGLGGFYFIALDFFDLDAHSFLAPYAFCLLSRVQLINIIIIIINKCISLVINNGLKEGTQLPYIRRAKKLGYGVLIMNTNHNKDDKGQWIRVLYQFQ